MVAVESRVISGMVMLVAVRPASASAFSASAPLKMARKISSSTLESTVSMAGMSTLKLVCGAGSVWVAGGLLVLVFWAMAAPAGSATLNRHADATMPRRRPTEVLNSMRVLLL
jgi:hypothetical protein